MSEWEVTILGEVLRLQYGKDHKTLANGSIPCFGSGGIIRYVNQAIYDEESILIPRKGTLNNILYQDKPFWTVDTMFWSKINTRRVLPKFLYYQLQLVDFTNLDVGSAVPSLTIPVISDIDILLPPFPEQKAISEVLSSLDDKIDLLHRQNRTLEAMAETLFRQWFIEEIEEDWEEIPLIKLCKTITKGTTPTTLNKSFVESGINFIKVNCFDEYGNFIFSKFDHIDSQTNQLLKRSQLSKGDILYSIAGTIGRIAQVPDYILPANVNQAIAIIRVNENYICPYYIKYYLKNGVIDNLLQSKIVHAVQPNLSLGEIGSILISIPESNNETYKFFCYLVSKIEELVEINKKNIIMLTEKRNLLLPKLISGEVRVKLE
jgi:type I restriction enzyme S subunit